MKRHYLDKSLIQPIDQIKVAVIGTGGTGSHLLQGLARMNNALLMLNHMGLTVEAFDDDVVSTSNTGRQLFHESDIGENKAVSLITRINRFYGYSWQGFPTKFNGGYYDVIMICVDTVKSRKEILKKISSKEHPQYTYVKNRYIFDFGNGKDYGQVFISTVGKIKQPESEFEVVDKIPYPKEVMFKAVEELNEPSCSLYEALQKQDLFINPLVADMGLSLLWKMLRQFYLEERGIYLNLSNYKTNPIKL